jgi:DedD protein
MAESHEPSYYEIALTNRQVIVAFVILLACILTAFFSGVWIGRESTARATQEALVRNTPPPQPAPKEGRSLDELEFFDNQSRKESEQAAAQPPAGTPPAPRDGGDTTLLEDFAGRDTPDRPRAPEPAVTEPADEPAPAAPKPAEETAAEKRERRKKEREERARKEAADDADAKPAKTAAKTTPEPSVPKGSVVIQVFSSPDRAQADSIRGRLSGGGQKAYISPIERGGRTMYRVRLGPFKTRDDAQKVADQVRKKYKLDTWVTE